MQWQALVYNSSVVAAVADFAVVSISLVVSDLRAMRLPNRIVARGYVSQLLLLGLACAAHGAWDSLLRGLLGSVALLALYCTLAASGEMGVGDAKLAALVGMVLGEHGWVFVWSGTLIAFAGAGCGALCAVAAGRRRSSRIPFGPWMLVGAWAVLALPHAAESMGELGP